MLEEMRTCINKEDVKAGLPDETAPDFDIDRIFIFWQQFRMKTNNLKKYIENVILLCVQNYRLYVKGYFLHIKSFERK